MSYKYSDEIENCLDGGKMPSYKKPTIANGVAVAMVLSVAVEWIDRNQGEEEARLFAEMVEGVTDYIGREDVPDDDVVQHSGEILILSRQALKDLNAPPAAFGELSHFFHSVLGTESEGPGQTGRKKVSREDHLKNSERFLRACHNVAEAKNKDYGDEDDALKNFQPIAGCTAQQGVLLRMNDKFSRLETHLSGDTLSTDSYTDALIDIINYAVILYSMEVEGV